MPNLCDFSYLAGLAGVVRHKEVSKLCKHEKKYGAKLFIILLFCCNNLAPYLIKTLSLLLIISTDNDQHSIFLYQIINIKLYSEFEVLTSICYQSIRAVPSSVTCFISIFLLNSRKKEILFKFGTWIRLLTMQKFHHFSLSYISHLSGVSWSSLPPPYHHSICFEAFLCHFILLACLDFPLHRVIFLACSEFLCCVIFIRLGYCRSCTDCFRFNFGFRRFCLSSGLTPVLS